MVCFSRFERFFILYLRNTTYIPEIGYREPVTFRVFDNENGDVYSLQFAFYFVQAPPLQARFQEILDVGSFSQRP